MFSRRSSAEASGRFLSLASESMESPCFSSSLFSVWRGLRRCPSAFGDLGGAVRTASHRTLMLKYNFSGVKSVILLFLDQPFFLVYSLDCLHERRQNHLRWRTNVPVDSNCTIVAYECFFRDNKGNVWIVECDLCPCDLVCMCVCGPCVC